jgi:hypothetical protein
MTEHHESAGWMIRCGEDVFNTPYIEKAMIYIVQHRRQEEVVDHRQL